MKAIVVKQSDKEPILSWQEVPDVTYGPEQVLGVMGTFYLSILRF